MNKKQRHWIIGLVTLSLFVGSTLVLVMPAAAAPLPLTIPQIQGDGFDSPYTGSYVQTTGVVTADFQAYGLKGGFFLQDPVGDGNPATSDGIFVYNYWYQVDVGDYVTVKGDVTEYYGLTEIPYAWITFHSSDNPLPAPVELYPPPNDDASDVYYEALEGMLVSVSELRVVAGTDVYREFAGVREELDIERVFRDDPDGTGELIFADDAGGVVVNVRSGNLVRDLVGPLDYTYDEYKVLPAKSAPPKVIPKGSGMGLGRGQFEVKGFSIATYNMFNLFDEDDNPDKSDDVYSTEEVERMLTKHAKAIHDFLREPDLIAVEEVETEELLERLAATPPIKVDYGAKLLEGPDDRGINVGLLYRMDRVAIVSATVHQTTTTLDDGYGPEGTNLLFSRPPLVVRLQILCKGAGKGMGNDNDGELWLIINHFKSKSVYGPKWAPTEPRRLEQAIYVASLVDDIQEMYPDAKVVVLGDLNDFEDSDPLDALTGGPDGLINLIYEIEKEDRYTYIYRGVSQVLDHILITPSLEDAVEEVQVIHFNPDYPFPQYNPDWKTGICSSDHDVLMAAFEVGDELGDVIED